MKQIIAAIAAFQQECPIIVKDTQAYGYMYADLATIIDEIKPLLAKHGLAYVHRLNGNNVITEVYHVESGEKITSIQPIEKEQLKGMNSYQVMGSAITYIRRYHLSSMLGIVTDKDDNDAQGQKENKASDNKAADNKPWLNKGTEEYKNVVAAMKNGYTIEQVKSKYKLSKEIETELLTLKK